jgi:hypothetical protein
MRFPNRSLGTRDGTGLRCRIVMVMLTSSRTRQAYLRVLVLVAVGVAAVAVLLNIPVVQAYFVTGVLGVLAGCFFFCAPFTVRGRVSPSWVRASFVVVAFALLFWTLLGPILFLSRLPMSSSMSGLLNSIRWILAGLTLGVVLSLNLSGGLVAWYRKK